MNNKQVNCDNYTNYELGKFMLNTKKAGKTTSQLFFYFIYKN